MVTVCQRRSVIKRTQARTRQAVEVDCWRLTHHRRKLVEPTRPATSVRMADHPLEARIPRAMGCSRQLSSGAARRRGRSSSELRVVRPRRSGVPIPRVAGSAGPARRVSLKRPSAEGTAHLDRIANGDRNRATATSNTPLWPAGRSERLGRHLSTD